MRTATRNFAAPCWALALVASWQLLGGQASAEETLPAPEQVAPEKVVVVQPGVTPGAPRLLYALDGGQMSISELRPGNMESEQLEVYLSMLHAPIDRQAALADPTLVLAAMLEPQAGEAAETGIADIQTAAAVAYTSEIMPRSYLAADGAWVFPRLPGKDEREILGLHAWRVEENPESQALFLGPDRRFGLDDFADLINPLQHVPLVNIAYRAITGDEIYGAARLLDMGFGPIAGVSTVVDLAVTDTTGASMSDHAVAALFGTDEAPATDDLAQVEEPAAADAAAVQSALVYDPLAYNPMAASYYPESAQLPVAAPAADIQ